MPQHTSSPAKVTASSTVTASSPSAVIPPSASAARTAICRSCRLQRRSSTKKRKKTEINRKCLGARPGNQRSSRLSRPAPASTPRAPSFSAFRGRPARSCAIRAQNHTAPQPHSYVTYESSFVVSRIFKREQERARRDAIRREPCESDGQQHTARLSSFTSQSGGEPAHPASTRLPSNRARVRLGSQFAPISPFDAPPGMAYHLHTGETASRRACKPRGRERGTSRSAVAAWVRAFTGTSLAGHPHDSGSFASIGRSSMRRKHGPTGQGFGRSRQRRHPLGEAVQGVS